MSRRSPATTAPTRMRCAIYTRKSSDEGLEQNFNSLHAQREACEAYVLSQAGEGWTALAAQYDDGGFSGGNMDRPGLDQLMADVDAGRIDIVVVYKVDRLTRSLADFAKIVERFDARGVSFVSVTQAFNTTNSMGRLTLNVLLSFAQFEREVTGERIRDKIAASKAKGMWMGGNVPLGYDAAGRTLAINAAEAEQVRHIFARYLALGSVHALRDELEAQGLSSKRRTTLAGKEIGGAPFSRGALFHLLGNRHYIGEIVHKDQSFPGNHPPIVDREVFDQVQLKLAQNAGPERRARVGLDARAPSAPLVGLVFDDRGNPMSPVNTRKGRGQIYRYYVSGALLQGRRQDAGSLPRFPGPVLEELLRDRLTRLGALGGADDLTQAIDRVEVGRGRLVVRLSRVDGYADLKLVALGPGHQLQVLEEGAVLTIATFLKRRGGAKEAIGPDGAGAPRTPKVELPLLRALVKAEAWKAKLLDQGQSFDEVVTDAGVNRAYAQRLIRIAFLSPELKRDILEGTASEGLNLQRLMQSDIPLAWADQRPRWNQ